MNDVSMMLAAKSDPAMARPHSQLFWTKCLSENKLNPNESFVI